MNKSEITFSANEQSLIKTGGIDNYASNTVSYIEATFTLGENWTGFDSVRAVWESYCAKISTVLDSNYKCIVPPEVLKVKSKVNVNLVGSVVEGNVLTDRLTTYPILALTVDANARVEGDETTAVTPSQFEQFVAQVHEDAESIQDYTYDSEAWAKGTRGGIAVSSDDPTYHNNSKYYADQGATLQQEVTDLKSDINDISDAVFEYSTVNLYNASLVTDDTVIRDKIVKWNGELADNSGKGVTPLLPIEPNTTYTIGLIPNQSAASTPWYALSTCGAFYDASGNNVGYWADTNTFTTPANATQFRMNLYLSAVALEDINRSCVMVKGSTLPSEYIPYADTRPTKLDDVKDAVYPFMEKHDLFGLAEEYVVGRYFDGASNVNSSYNYYSKIPINKGDSYKFNNMVRFVAIMVGGSRVALYGDITEFTSDYDGYAYVTIYANKTDTIMTYNNDFVLLETATNDAFNGHKVAIVNKSAEFIDFSFKASVGDVVHFGLSGYSGSHFSYAFLYNVVDGTPQTIYGTTLYSSNGEALFIAEQAITTIRVYVALTATESSEITAIVTNISEQTAFNKLIKHDIFERLHSSIYGKKIACLGDSFTYGDETYVKKMNTRYLSKAVNYGVASSRIVLDNSDSGTTVYSFLNRYASMDSDAEIITVFGGINDSYDLGAGTLALGNINSALNTSTFYGGLKLLVTNLMKKYPDKQIVGIIPPDCQYGQYYIDNLPLVQVAEREVYGMYGIPIIDLKRECYKMSTLAEMVALYRGSSTDIHPSDAGQEALCDTISAGIRRIIP